MRMNRNRNIFEGIFKPLLRLSCLGGSGYFFGGGLVGKGGVRVG